LSSTRTGASTSSRGPNGPSRSSRAAQYAWSIVRLRAEIKRTKDPAPRTPASRNNGCVITDARASLDLKRPLARSERDELAPRITKALAALGYTRVVIGDTAA
jgi:hypothetical protein